MPSLPHVFDKEPEEWLTTINTEKATLYKRRNKLIHSIPKIGANTVQELKSYTPDPQYLDISYILRCDKQRSHFINAEKDVAFDNVVFHGTIKWIDNYGEKTYLKIENPQNDQITVIADKNYKLKSSDTTIKLPAYLDENVFIKLKIITNPSTKIFQCHNPKFETFAVDDAIIVSGKLKEFNGKRYIFPNNTTVYQIPKK